MARIFAATAALLLAGAAPASDPVSIAVRLERYTGNPQSGRLLVFAKRVEPGAKPESEAVVQAVEKALGGK